MLSQMCPNEHAFASPHSTKLWNPRLNLSNCKQLHKSSHNRLKQQSTRPQPHAPTGMCLAASSNTQLLSAAFPLDAAASIIARQPSVLKLQGLSDWLDFFTAYGVPEEGLRSLLLFSAEVLQDSTPYIAGVWTCCSRWMLCTHRFATCSLHPMACTLIDPTSGP